MVTAVGIGFGGKEIDESEDASKTSYYTGPINVMTLREVAYLQASE
jgi:hypothetical protein